jgi:hypothetical protein
VSATDTTDRLPATIASRIRVADTVECRAVGTPCWHWLGVVRGVTPFVTWEGREVHAARLVYHLLVDSEAPLWPGRRGARIRRICKTDECVSPLHVIPSSMSIGTEGDGGGPSSVPVLAPIPAAPGTRVALEVIRGDEVVARMADALVVAWVPRPAGVLEPGDTLEVPGELEPVLVIERGGRPRSPRVTPFSAIPLANPQERLRWRPLDPSPATVNVSLLREWGE